MNKHSDRSNESESGLERVTFKLPMADREYDDTIVSRPSVIFRGKPQRRTAVSVSLADKKNMYK